MNYNNSSNATGFSGGNSLNVENTLNLIKAFEARAAAAAAAPRPAAAASAPRPAAAASAPRPAAPAAAGAAPAAAGAAPAAPTCSNKHALVSTVWTTNRWCDLCRKKVPAQTEVMFSCKACDEDVCQACMSRGGKAPQAGVVITPTMAAASAVHNEEVELLVDVSVEMVKREEARHGNGAICPTGLAVMTLLLQSATMDPADRDILAALVGVTVPADVPKAIAGQKLSDPARSIHGAVMVMAPDANPDYVEFVSQVIGDAAVVRKDFDRGAADAFVQEKTCGLIQEAFTGDLPAGNVNLMITMVNAFAGRWNCEREALPAHQFKHASVQGVKFKDVCSAWWDDRDFKGAAVPFEGEDAHVFGVFIQPLGSMIDVYDALRKVLRGDGCKYNVEAPEFAVESKLDLKEHTGTMSLPLIAPGAELAVFQQQVSVKVDIHGAVAASATTAVVLTRGAACGPRVLHIDKNFFFCIVRADAEVGVVPLFVTKVTRV